MFIMLMGTVLKQNSIMITVTYIRAYIDNRDAVRIIYLKYIRNPSTYSQSDDKNLCTCSFYLI